MPFDTLSDRLKAVANRSLALCRTNWGRNGLKMEIGIHDDIAWQPTFFLKPTRTLIVAVEVNDVLYPTTLKSAAHDIDKVEFPITIYQACSFDVYQRDPSFTKVNSLRADGFGIITVDTNGAAIIQARAEPLTQHISPGKLDKEIKALTPTLKVKFRGAHATYQTNVGQGLQEAGQIIEAMIICMCEQAETHNVVQAGASQRALANVIDALYAALNRHRAALGAARSFTRTFRNTVSHPARTPAEAAAKIQKCKDGFLEALRIASELRGVIQDLGYRLNIQ